MNRLHVIKVGPAKRCVKCIEEIAEDKERWMRGMFGPYCSSCRDEWQDFLNAVEDTVYFWSFKSLPEEIKDAALKGTLSRTHRLVQEWHPELWLAPRPTLEDGQLELPF